MNGSTCDADMDLSSLSSLWIFVDPELDFFTLQIQLTAIVKSALDRQKSYISLYDHSQSTASCLCDRFDSSSMNAYPYEDEEVDDDTLANEEYEADAWKPHQRHQSDQDLLEPSTDNFKVHHVPILHPCL